MFFSFILSLQLGLRIRTETYFCGIWKDYPEEPIGYSSLKKTKHASDERLAVNEMTHCMLFAPSPKLEEKTVEHIE